MRLIALAMIFFVSIVALVKQRFIQKQIRDVQQGGISVFAFKVKLFLPYLIGIPLALPVVIIIRLLRPFQLIRLGQLVSGRIGHFAANTELYLCERDVGVQNSRAYDIFYHSDTICNAFLKKKWEEILWVSKWVEWPDKLNRMLPGGKIHQINWSSGDQDVHNLIDNSSPHVSFSTQEEIHGQVLRKHIGIPDNTPFVCFYARDSAYLNTIYPNRRDWQYHNYRDSNIENYLLAAEALTKQGYYTVRMGAVVLNKLTTENPRVIDYAGSDKKDDFLDIYLCAKCKFFVGSTGGINAVPRMFRKPVVYVNFIPTSIAHFLTCMPNSLILPKKLWLKKEKRFMTFQEIIASGAGQFFYTEQYKKMGIEVIENTPEEIAEITIEMDKRLKGLWKTRSDDEQLQSCFWNFFPEKERLGFSVRVGADFLCQNRNLLK